MSNIHPRTFYLEFTVTVGAKLRCKAAITHGDIIEALQSPRQKQFVGKRTKICPNIFHLPNWHGFTRSRGLSRFRYLYICQGNLNQETAKGIFRSTSQAATCYY